MTGTTPDAASPLLARAVACGIATGLVAAVMPVLSDGVARGWLAGTFGAAAPAMAVTGGVIGAVLAGITVGVILAGMRASQAVFLGAWGGTTLLRLFGLAVLLVWPLGVDGARQGLLVGYVAAVFVGSVVEVPVVWIAGTRGLSGAARTAEVAA